MMTETNSKNTVANRTGRERDNVASAARLRTGTEQTNQSLILQGVVIMTGTKNFEFNVFITNLALYNEGILHGEYVDFVNLDLDEIWNEINRICYNPRSYEPDKIDEWFITDYDTSIDCEYFSEYEDIAALKEKVDFYAEFFEEYGDYAENIIDAMEQHYSSNQEIIDHLKSGEFRIYTNCNDMTDVAYEVAEECGYLDQIPDHLRNYFDFEALGRDLKCEGYFYYTSDSVYVEIF